jgi:integrase
VLEAARERRNGARFTLGLRQGEALGLTWPYVDLDAGRSPFVGMVYRPFAHG